MITPPARSRARGSGPLPFQAGFSATELAVTMAILVTATAVAAPGAMRLRAALSVRSAAAQTGVAFLQARAYAIARGRYVGLKFRKNGTRHEWALYVDGNGNGIRTADIERGVDRPLGFAFPWQRNDVLPGIMRGTRVPDPGSPGRALENPDDPIRFNSSDICSFSPLGESTPGSVYLWDGHDRMAVVRVFGRTAKLRTLYYRRGDREWKQ